MAPLQLREGVATPSWLLPRAAYARNQQREEEGWYETAPGPELPDDVVAGTRARYVDAFERVTGIPFDDYLADPGVVLK